MGALDGGVVGRNVFGMKCPSCKGHADEVDCTPEEIAGPKNCGRPWACCVAAFVCGLCGKRIVARREAPEME
jgi:hypothetical protein